MLILISIENATRELDSGLVLALRAARRGHQTLILDQSELSPLIARKSFPAGTIFHTKSATPSPIRVRQMDYFRKLGYLISVQDQEHGILGRSFKDFALPRYSEESMSMVDLLFAWGDFDFEGLRKMFPDQRNKVKKVGSPRADIWTSPFANNPYVSNPVAPKRYVLFPSNFGINHTNRHWQLYDAVRRIGEYSAPFEEPARRELHRLSIELSNISNWLDLFQRFNQRWPETLFVIRPHPNEDPNAWQALCKGLRGVHVERSGPVTPWIRNAAALVHAGSTTALEAQLAGVPAVLFSPGEVDAQAAYSTETREVAKSVSDVIESLEEFFSNNGGQNSRSEVGRIYRVDGELSSDRIIDFWEAADAGRGAEHAATARLLRSLKLVALQRNDRRRQPVRRKVDPNGSMEKKFPEHTKAEITTKFNLLRTEFGNQNTKLKWVSPRAFLVSTPVSPGGPRRAQ